MISLGNLCSFLEVFLCHNLCEVYHMLPQHQAYDLLLRLCFLQIPQDPFSCSFLLTKRLKSFCSSSQLESLTHSSLSLCISESRIPSLVCLFLLCLCVYSCMPFFPPQEGSGPVLFLLSKETRVKKGRQENCTLCYFERTIFFLLS
jgi:hypothetical protein